MTRNNLSEHLSWLLNSKISIPPAANALPPVSLSFTQAEPSRAVESTAEFEDVVEAVATGPGQVAASTDTQDVMARLRTEAGSAGKPNLVTMSPRLPETPHRSAQGAASGKVAGPNPEAFGQQRPTPYSTARQGLKSPQQDVEIMDLTESLDQMRSPTANRVAGRKRKSAEMAHGSPAVALARPGLTGPVEAMPPPHRASQQSFTAIDEIIGAPTDPPPPYSTHAPGDVSPVGLVPRRTATTSRSSISSGADGTPVMPDSEDDDDDIIDFSRSRGMPAPEMKAGIRQEPRSRDAVPESPSKPSSVARVDSSTLLARNTETALRKTFRPDAKVVEHGAAQAATATAPASTSSLRGAQDEDQIAVEQLFGLASHFIAECCQRLHAEYERRLDELTECIENDQETGDLQNVLDDAEKRYHSLQVLASKQKDYTILLEEKDQLRVALREAIRARTGQHEAKCAIDACRVKVQGLVLGGCEHLRLCRFEVSDLLRRAASDAGGFRKVAVQSTQAQTTDAVMKQSCIPSSSRIAQTQVVKCNGISAPPKQAGAGGAQYQYDGPPNIEAYFSPSRKSHAPISKPEIKRQYAQHAAFGDGRDDEFDDVDENELVEADNRMVTNRMSPPPVPSEDGEEFDDVDMLEFAESYERPDAQHRPTPGNPSRLPLAPTSGNSQSKIDCRSPKRKKRAPSKNNDANLERLFRFPWSNDVKATLRDRFRLRGFRENQLQAINATLAGKDVFVLMPTGGGKSLCYQLPSLVDSGKTHGVTIVISPLLSLMEDQVQHLRKLDIQAFLINSETPQDMRHAVMEAMHEERVEDFVQLLYVTPEMLSKSQKMINAFERLYRRQKLARLVIDEAHCVSQWGHDFRPDYKLLGDVRKRFPRVPVMALTATATENVKTDTVHNLGITGCEIFTSSFNRPNLYYEVRPKAKGKEDVKSIAELIKDKYPRKTGIIYCLSRKNCETMAETLRADHKIKAHHYHAGLEPQQKRDVQKDWQAGVHHVIVATIAFGMGIDKPDVRFVIHHTVPKSLEGYYQETGRAGRDQLPSGCYLFYGFQDVSKLRRMIDDGDGDWAQKERQHQMLRRMAQYCDNRSDCRRVQVLRYFNENFDRENCGGECDNCNSTSSFETVDFTSYAQQAVSLVSRVAPQKVTLLHCIDIFRGGSNKKIVDSGHNELPEFAAGKDIDRGDVERLFFHLVTEQAIIEENFVNKIGFAHQYVALGRYCTDFRAGRKQLNMQIRSSPKAKAKAKAPSKKKGKRDPSEGQSRGPRRMVGIRGQAEMPMSTNISSPVQAADSRRKNNKCTAARMHGNGYQRDDFVVSGPEDEDYGDSDEDDSSEGFEAMIGHVRIAGRPLQEKTRTPGGPITGDKAMDSLDDVHRDMVEQFVHNGREEARNLMLKKDLRNTPFSDTMLRDMAINWTETEDQMLKIRGMNHENVQLHGKRFCKLVKQFHEHYNEAMQIDQRPNPDDQNVIDLVSDDEDEDEEEYGDISMDEDEPGESSGYFQHPAPSAAVAAFTARVEQSESAARQRHAGANKPKTAGKKRTFKATGSTAAPRRKRFSGGSRFASYGYEGQPTAGVGKKKAGGKRVSRDGGKSGSGAGGGRSAPKNTGGASGSIISMMPI